MATSKSSSHLATGKPRGAAQRRAGQGRACRAWACRASRSRSRPSPRRDGRASATKASGGGPSRRHARRRWRPRGRRIRAAQKAEAEKVWPPVNDVAAGGVAVEDLEQEEVDGGDQPEPPFCLDVPLGAAGVADRLGVRAGGISARPRQDRGRCGAAWRGLRCGPASRFQPQDARGLPVLRGEASRPRVRAYALSSWQARDHSTHY